VAALPQARGAARLDRGMDEDTWAQIDDSHPNSR